jgi:AcrR family transcriptional regulator
VKRQEHAKAKINKPQQERSRATLQRLLEATETILNESSYESLTVREVLRISGVSNGSFYARFDGIEALLQELWRVVTDSMDEFFDETTLARKDWGLSQRVQWVVERRIDRFVKYRGLMRAFTMLIATGRLPVQDRERRQYRESQKALLRFFKESESEISHPEPAKAIELAEFAIAATARSLLLFPDAPHSETIQISVVRLKQEMTKMFLNYLQAGRD